MRTGFRPLLDGYRAEAKEDQIGLCQIISHMKRDFGAKNEQEVMGLTLEFVREMLAEGFEAGNPVYSSTGYVPWKNQSPDYILSRIQTEWEALGQTPNIPHIAWFGLPAYTSGTKA